MPRVARALGYFVRSLRAEESPFDRFLAGDPDALSHAALRGLDLFAGRARCSECHALEGKRPALTDGLFHDTGVAWRARRENGDKGRTVRTLAAPDLRRFKTPTLRDATRREFFMHDGSFDSLEAVVRYYAAGGSSDDPNLDPAIVPLGLSDAEVEAIVAFLGSLTGDQRPGRGSAAWEGRTERSEIRVFDRWRRPVAGVRVRILPAGDPLAGAGTEESKPVTVVTDGAGSAAFPTPPTTHYEARFPESILPDGGPRVPDTCRRAEIVLPVDGRFSFDVVFPAGTDPPSHCGASMVLGARWTLFPLERAWREGPLVVARYGHWLRDAAARLDFLLRDPLDPDAAPSIRLHLEPGVVPRVDRTR
jgi:hypothetical protein